MNELGELIGFGFIVYCFYVASYLYDEKLIAEAEALKEAREHQGFFSTHYNHDLTYADNEYERHAFALDFNPRDTAA